MEWTNNHTDGYIIQLTEKVNNRADHLLTKNNVKYILVLSSGTSVDGLFLYNELQGGQKRVSDLISNGTILRVDYYENADESLGLTLTDLPRQRQYLSIAKLSKRAINRNAMLIEKASARSQQEVAGIQTAGDNL